MIKDSSDAGGITLKKPGLYNTIDNNRIHDIYPPDDTTGRCLGVYLDDSTEYTTIKNNIIYDIQSAGDSYQCVVIKKANNEVTNNILVAESGSLGGINIQTGSDTGSEPYTGYGDHEITKNIIYSKGASGVILSFLKASDFDCDKVYKSDSQSSHKSVNSALQPGLL